MLLKNEYLSFTISESDISAKKRNRRLSKQNNMLKLLKKLLFQIRCGYCFKPISEDEEKRFGKVSLCPDCYNYIRGGHSAVYSVGSSTAFSKVKVQTVPKSKSRHFHNRTFFEEKEHLQNGKSGDNLPLLLRLFYRPFRGDLND